MKGEREILVVGGINGAGKTTAARILQPEFFEKYEFLNADEIARSISPQNVEAAALAAGRVLIARMRESISEGTSFGLETTCSGKSYLRLLNQCKAEGWRVILLYFWLDSPETAIARVAQRVGRGGHDIPEEVIRRRYPASIRNMRDFYLPVADEAEIYDNSDKVRNLIAEKRAGHIFTIHDRARWSRIEEVVE
ncbi:MAG TPA: AAA family ATPase [Terracidiphilus sp.]|nr:AAA family ATPase [Terracidiphilus sp.]